MQIAKALSLLMLVLILSSCGSKLQYFTDDLRQEYGWTEPDLQKIQFYLSEDVVLHRGAGRERTSISGGKIRVIDGRRVEEIIFERGTPGVFLFTPDSSKDHFAISFEDRGVEKFLMFGPNKKTGGRFVLLAKEWDRNNGKVSYGEQLYSTTSESAYASLLVDMKKAKKVKYKTKVARGRRVE